MNTIRFVPLVEAIGPYEISSNIVPSTGDRVLYSGSEWEVVSRSFLLGRGELDLIEVQIKPADPAGCA